MTWARVDDELFENPKVAERSKDAKLLYVAGLTYCAKFLTDGYIGPKGVKRIRQLIEARASAVKELAAAGLWEPQEDGRYYVHDWHKYNPPAAKVKAEREAARIRMARLRERSPEQGSEQGGELPPEVQPSPSHTPSPLPESRDPEPEAPEPERSLLPLLKNHYESEIGSLTPMVEDALREWAERIPDERFIQYAFKEASANGARNWKYIESIFARLEAEGWPAEMEAESSEDERADWLERRYDRGKEQAASH